MNEDASEKTNAIDFIEVLMIWLSRKGLIAIVTILAGAAALGASYLIPLTFTARTTFIPPQQQSATSSLAASLGALSSLTGGAVAKSPAEQYVSLLQSDNIADRIVDKFDLMKVYEARYRFGARATLAKNTRVSLGKKDGLITIEVDAQSPQLAADIANYYVAELRRLSSELVLSEAQERRAFYEGKLKQTRAALQSAQEALQRSGFDAGALKAEPRSAAEAYARIRAEITSAEIRLQTLRRAFAENSPEVQQQLTMLSALRIQAGKLESTSDGGRSDTGYVAAYREYKYQEGLFEAFSKQFEMARLDESREGSSIQVVDPAGVPEYKSKPKRGALAISVALAALVIMLTGVVVAHWWRAGLRDPHIGPRLQRLRQAAGMRRRVG
ncbi:Wzz/FepE/Etk N-terminal domain-containing protein [Pelomonas sp. P7]|uniref:Wzz/FepE/Etk N-terminal domain-containing protein n=1 Tax=Pelomonas caseinilytica TaxID=2906763 RepID=A0ABS8XB71_9BURK|nr:Wzz/FepE/Etk N-terminal domain-containing protein [Pelomonas sp. P7]MCE4538187.1 Wzz/FepE/Etk N-terminal domain-containing protein [Pelomonas sp. P7]